MRALDEILVDAQILFTFLSDAEAPPGSADVVLAMGSHDLNVAGTAVRAFREMAGLQRRVWQGYQRRLGGAGERAVRAEMPTVWSAEGLYFY